MKFFYNFILFFLFSFYSFSQVGINTTSPDPSSILDISATNKGVLFPRVALTGINDNRTVANPAEGLLIYNTTNNSTLTSGFYVWDGSTWNLVNTGNNSGGGSTGSTKEYGEIFLANNATLQLSHYTDNLSLPNMQTTGLSSSNVKLLSNGIQPKVSGTYKVTYTVTYQRVTGVNSAIKNIEFYLSKNNNRINNTATVTEILDTEIHSFTTVKLLHLDAYQTYFINVSKTGPSGTNITPIPEIKIFGGTTNMIIERID